ncbi:perilipin-2-like isoform X2 [Carassius carassius]|nr:perilipin-2-like isoform X2 [Carassius carassius]
MANDMACKGLDKIEKTLPILHKPSDQIFASAKEAVTGAKEAVSSTMNCAKVSVSFTLSEVTDRTRGAVEKTKTAVSGGVQSVMESRVVKLMSSSVSTALSTSETLLEQYLPETEEDRESEEKNSRGLENNSDAPSYYVRLGSLSSRVRDRAYQRAVDKVHNAIQCSQVSISQLNHTMDLNLHDKLSSLMGWKSQEEDEMVTHNEAEQIESHTLTIAHNLSQQLKSTCVVLVSSLKGLPQHIQVRVQIYSSFSKVAALEDLSNSVLASSRSQLSRIRDSTDNVMDYLVNNTPLNWLVGPFYLRVEHGTADSPECDKPKTLRVTE